MRSLQLAPAVNSELAVQPSVFHQGYIPIIAPINPDKKRRKRGSKGRRMGNTHSSGEPTDRPCSSLVLKPPEKPFRSTLVNLPKLIRTATSVPPLPNAYLGWFLIVAGRLARGSVFDFIYSNGRGDPLGTQDAHLILEKRTLPGQKSWWKQLNIYKTAPSQSKLI